MTVNSGPSLLGYRLLSHYSSLSLSQGLKRLSVEHALLPAEAAMVTKLVCDYDKGCQEGASPLNGTDVQASVTIVKSSHPPWGGRSKITVTFT